MLFSEPKIPQNEHAQRRRTDSRFQCSSASRKFLKFLSATPIPAVDRIFSALQRAENSSKEVRRSRAYAAYLFSVLFSEPKIPQMMCCDSSSEKLEHFSVLFSEPKIPHWTSRVTVIGAPSPFQCSSASRKFLKWGIPPILGRKRAIFSALQRAENSSLMATRLSETLLYRFSVLFSEPKIPHWAADVSDYAIVPIFSALQRAENSSNAPRTCVHPYFRPR